MGNPLYGGFFFDRLSIKQMIIYLVYKILYFKRIRFFDIG